MFIEEYLEDLRRSRFSLRAFGRYARRAAARAREAMVANPGAVRSVWTLALGFFAVAFVASAFLALAGDGDLAYAFLVTSAITLVAVFALVTLHIDLLRDREGYRLSALNLPIALTLLRIALLPSILLFIAGRRFGVAFALFLVAALSDVLDGAIARRWRQVTKLGTVLDPIVDIVFNLCVALGLGFAGLLPGWVCALAVLRYAILLAGGISLYLFVGPVRIRPTMFGRMTGVASSGLLALLLLLPALDVESARALTPITQAALAVLLGATVIHVVALGWYNLKLMTGQVHATGRVVGDVRWGAP
jgi:cardiolipin synthase